MTDLCASAFCADMAAPGHDHCTACRRELEQMRAEFMQIVARVTAEHEAAVIEQDEAAA